ncbi:MAG: hypothetical protein WEB07_00870, partial [Natronospirillum sp.]
VAILLYVLLWIGFRYVPARNLRWFLRSSTAAVLIVPWRGTEPEEYFAPAIIVGAFAFMDTGLTAALAELELLLAVILVLAVITLIKEIIEFGWRWRSRSAAPKQEHGQTDHEVKE